MNTELLDLAPLESRAKIAAEAAQRRNREAGCAMDFLIYGDEHARGPHSEFCVFVQDGGTACVREYDPTPYPEATPADPRMYEGTGIAALYGLPGGEAHAWQLAGWNLRKEGTR